MNSKTFLEEYLKRPVDGNRLCPRCGRELREGDSNYICGICSYLQKALIKKQSRKRDINTELTDAGYSLRIASGATTMHFKKQKNSYGAQFGNSHVISINTKKILKLAKEKDIDEAKIAAAVISHEYFHYLLGKEQNRLTSSLFDCPFMKKIITPYLGGIVPFKFYKDFKGELKEQIMYELMKSNPEIFGIKTDKEVKE